MKMKNSTRIQMKRILLVAAALGIVPLLGTLYNLFPRLCVGGALLAGLVLAIWSLYSFTAFIFEDSEEGKDTDTDTGPL